MWATKFLVYDKDGVYSSRARKFKINIYGYPLNFYSDKRYFYFIGLGFLDGNKKTKADFVSDLKRDKRVHKLEFNDSFFICITKETKSIEAKKFVHLFYDPSLIRLRPSVIYSNGWEENEIACFEKRNLNDILKISEGKYELDLKYLKKTKVGNIGVLNIFPGLTDKQKNAMDLAVKEGYYEYPRKTEVQKLAKISGVSFSTFQEHLRKAENKLLPFAAKKSG